MATLTAVWMGDRELGGALEAAQVGSAGGCISSAGLREWLALNVFADVEPASAR